MSASAQQLLEDLRQKQDGGEGTAGGLLEELRAQEAPPERSGGVIDTLSRNIAQPFNKGLTDLINLPIDIPNMLLSAFTGAQIPGPAELRASTQDLGLTAAPGEEAEGFIPRTAELLGASAIPGGLLQGAGRQVLKQGIPQAQQSILQALTSTVAKNPRAALVADVAGSASAAGSGEIARTATDDPALINTAEVIGGLGLPAALSQVPRVVSATAKALPVTGTIIKGVGGVKNSFNTKARTTKRLQELASDPQAAASKIDQNSPVSPARQTEEPRLIALEERARVEGSSAAEKAAAKKAKEATQEAVKDASNFPGDTAAPRAVIEQKAKDTISRVTKRADAALEKADEAISKLDGGTSPRDISRTERGKLEAALDSARKEEAAVWSLIDSKAPAEATNTRKLLKQLKAEESKITLKKNMPEDIGALLKKRKAPLTLNDLKSVRSEIGAQMAKLKAEAGTSNKLRIHTKFYNALLDDMAAVDAEGVKAARKFSKQLNDKFTKGEVGEILGTSNKRVPKVDDPETLGKLLAQPSATRGIRQMIKASPESREGIEQFVRSRFITQAVDEKTGAINQATARRAIKNLRERGVFEEFPELEAQLLDAAKTGAKAANLAERAKIVKARGGARLAQDSKESLASTFLGEEVGKETALLLKAKDPIQMARKLVRAMGNNDAANQGLRRSFAEVLLKRAESTNVDDFGEHFIVGATYTKLLKDNIRTLKALGFTDPQITRMKRSATILRQIQAKPGKLPKQTVVDDAPGDLLAVPARVGGAILGGKVARGTSGGSIQTAGIFASRAEKSLEFLTTDRAKRMLIDIQDDPALYKAFLLGNKAPKAEKEKALKALNAWLFGLGADVAGPDTESEP